jgi:hypothetical protein
VTTRSSVSTVRKIYSIEDTRRSQEEADPVESPYSGQSFA